MATFSALMASCSSVHERASASFLRAISASFSASKSMDVSTLGFLPSFGFFTTSSAVPSSSSSSAKESVLAALAFFFLAFFSGDGSCCFCSSSSASRRRVNSSLDTRPTVADASFDAVSEAAPVKSIIRSCGGTVDCHAHPSGYQ